MRNLMRRHQQSPWASDIQNEINKIMQETFGEFNLTPMTEVTFWRPAIEMLEKDGKYNLKVQLPGIDKKDVNVELNNDYLVISGKKECGCQKEEKQYFKTEFRYGSFSRRIDFPSIVKSEEAQACFKHGELKIEVPLAEVEETGMHKLELKD